MSSVNPLAVVAVGEPGCYVHPGHVDHAELLREVLDCWEESDEDLEPARHTWMRVKAIDEDDEDDEGWDEGHTHRYWEVREGTEGAEPYTLIAIEGEWVGVRDGD